MNLDVTQVTRIVGLDLSLTATGFYVFAKDSAPGVDGHFGILDSAEKGIVRLNSILSRASLLFGNGGGLAVIEDFSFASRGRAVFEIGGLQYLVRHRLWMLSVPMLLVSPPQVKKFATGAGNADKSLMLKEVYKRWSADFSDDNVADAYVLARIGRAYLGWDTELTAFQADVLKKLRERKEI